MKTLEFWMSPRVVVVVTIIVALAIGLLTLTPLSELAKPKGSDKLHHFIAFFVLVLPMIAVNLRNAKWLVPAAIAYGGLIELIQPHVNRWGEWGDLWADAAGAIAGAVIGAAIYWKINRTARKV